MYSQLYYHKAPDSNVYPGSTIICVSRVYVFTAILFSWEYIHPGYTHYCRPWIHSVIMINFDRIAVNTYTLDSHTIVDPGYTLLFPSAL